MARPRKPSNQTEKPEQEDQVQDQDTEENTAEAEAEQATSKKKTNRGQSKKKAQSEKAPYAVEPGDIVSLDMRKRKFLMFPLPGGNIFRLSPGEKSEDSWWAKVPENTPERFLKSLSVAMEMGDIVRGKEFLPAYPKDDRVIEAYCKKLELSLDRLVKELKPLVLHKGLIGGYMCADIIRYMMAFEQKHYHRKQYLELLQEALDHIGGPGPVTVTPVKDITIGAAEDLAEEFETAR